MTKLIQTFRQTPTGINRARLQGHINRHPMAICMVSVEDIAFLTANGFRF